MRLISIIYSQRSSYGSQIIKPSYTATTDSAAGTHSDTRQSFGGPLVISEAPNGDSVDTATPLLGRHGLDSSLALDSRWVRRQ